ncbi:MscL family protein [Patescibacteria group bacterium]|nr:MscL family protein [Patescibacteria group bacterium]
MAGLSIRGHATRLVHEPRKLVGGFRDFIQQYGVLPLAIGVVIGTAVNDLVKTLVDGLVTPFIALIAPEGKMQNFQVVFHGSIFKIGAVVNSLLSFLIVALLVYLTVKLIIRDEELLKKE